MSSGKIEKMEVDYSSSVDENIPIIKSLAEANKLDDAIEKLMSLEKQTRSAADAISTGRLLECMVQICADLKQWKMLNEYLLVLTKKRGQLKQAVTKMVQKACEYLDKTPNLDSKLELIHTLRTVTEGKIYVEVERAHLTRALAQIRENEGNIEEAASVLQELQVETFGSMEKKEKIEFILEQMRLCAAKKDFIRTQIISKKVAIKYFQEPGTEDLKLKYYNLMILVDSHDGSYLSISKHFREIYNTKSIQDDQEKKLHALKHVIVYLLLAPYDNEQNDMLHRYIKLRDTENIPQYQNMLTAFATTELLHWPEFCKQFEDMLRKETDVFSTSAGDDSGAKRWEDMHTRVVEHNIRVIAAYYTQITMLRLAQLLDLSEPKTEEFLSNLVVNKNVQAKIDRLQGVVRFTEKQQPTDILNDWSYNINNLMSLIAKTNHLINKEKMIHHI